jgi:hypothetical protein
MRTGAFSKIILTLVVSLSPIVGLEAQTSPFIYGLHDHDTNIQEYLDHFNNGGVSGWVTATLSWFV